jgi:hypothetical protein
VQFITATALTRLELLAQPVLLFASMESADHLTFASMFHILDAHTSNAPTVLVLPFGPLANAPQELLVATTKLA